MIAKFIWQRLGLKLSFLVEDHIQVATRRDAMNPLQHLLAEPNASRVHLVG
jgi:hypothetical protein